MRKCDEINFSEEFPSLEWEKFSIIQLIIINLLRLIIDLLFDKFKLKDLYKKLKLKKTLTGNSIYSINIFSI